jgi:hypothetical protein
MSCVFVFDPANIQRFQHARHGGQNYFSGGYSEGLAELIETANDNILAPRSFGHRLPFLLNPLL